MEIKVTKTGTKIFLKDFPTKRELAILNKLGSFEICERKGYKRLLDTKIWMECPINQWWRI